MRAEDLDKTGSCGWKGCDKNGNLSLLPVGRGAVKAYLCKEHHRQIKLANFSDAVGIKYVKEVSMRNRQLN